ncbi:hypothetical protein [Vreelandella alkaliphila]|uniref:Uncharacterized protein n=1 Tax=Vreelandella alkaliphila TaxID=272774 RepID=A0AAJ2RW41_9GAMM|nr:hypothetical protein [Halomonas alkaliphila]MDX5979548.1 hypothetical protein [Halomonas alkaliphila]
MGWLVDRLTPYKREQPRWHDLAVALETYWDTYNTPALERIEQMRSVFTAHNEDVEALLREAGVQFEVGLPIIDGNRAFAYAWRSYEIHRKDNAAVLGQVLSRDFSGLDVRWEPLLAPKNKPYGHGEFLTLHDIELMGLDRHDYFRTYRGVVMANLPGIHSVGYDTEAFSAAVKRKVDVLRPAHVVHDGEYFFSVFRSLIELPVHLYRHAENVQPTWFELGARYLDNDAQDGEHLDQSPLESMRDTNALSKRLLSWEMPAWGLDAGKIIDGSYWGLIGIEGDKRQAFGVLGHHHQPITHIGSTLASQGLQEAIKQVAPAYWTLGRYPFDVLRADDHLTDVWGGSPFPGWTQQSRNGQSLAKFWSMPPWGLDLGLSIEGEHWGLEGVEGAVARRFVSRQHRRLIGMATLNPKFSKAPRAIYSLPPVTNCYNECSPSVALTPTVGGQSVARHSSVSTTQRLLYGPAFDELPGDVAPLDMHYEEA